MNLDQSISSFYRLVCPQCQQILAAVARIAHRLRCYCGQMNLDYIISSLCRLVCQKFQQTVAAAACIPHRLCGWCQFMDRIVLSGAWGSGCRAEGTLPSTL